MFTNVAVGRVFARAHTTTNVFCFVLQMSMYSKMANFEKVLLDSLGEEKAVWSIKAPNMSGCATVRVENIDKPLGYLFSEKESNFSRNYRYLECEERM